MLITSCVTEISLDMKIQIKLSSYDGKEENIKLYFYE